VIYDNENERLAWQQYPCGSKTKSKTTVVSSISKKIAVISTGACWGIQENPSPAKRQDLTKFLRYVFQEHGAHDFRRPGTCEASDSRMCEVRGS
jgi:hypothetical protein